MQPCIAEGLGGQTCTLHAALLGCFQTAPLARAHRFSCFPSLPAAAYPEHFSAVGANAIAIYDAANCWVQDVSGMPALKMNGPTVECFMPNAAAAAAAAAHRCMHGHSDQPG